MRKADKTKLEKELLSLRDKATKRIQAAKNDLDVDEIEFSTENATEEADCRSREARATHVGELASDELSQIDRALERVRESSPEDPYGMCVDCRGGIDVRRLLALPFALRCILCQEAHETTMKLKDPHGVL